LKCRNQVDPKTASRMLYQGRTFYFCTESDRAEFAKDPGKYVKAPAQSAPAHAH
jgi:YHS domain-containing protein